MTPVSKLKSSSSYVYDVFSSLVLAIWFIDDEYYKSSVMSVKAKYRYGKKNYCIRVYRSSVNYMRELMKPHIHPVLIL